MNYTCENPHYIPPYRGRLHCHVTGSSHFLFQLKIKIENLLKICKRLLLEFLCLDLTETFFMLKLMKILIK